MNGELSCRPSRVNLKSLTHFDPPPELTSSRKLLLRSATYLHTVSTERGDTVDVVARFGFPLDLSPCRRARHATLVFGTAEFGIVTPRMLNASANVAMEWWHERRCLARKQSSSSVVRIVTPSKWSRDAFLRSGFAPSHVYVIPHGVDTELIHPPASPEVKRRLQR